MASQSFATIGELKTHYLHAGQGSTLILLHGQLPGSTAQIEFGATVDHFAGLGYAVYAPDLASFGLTDNPSDYAVEGHIAHAAAFVDFIAPERYGIWGCSMGTYIGAQIALVDRRVERLIIMPGNVLPPASRGKRGAQRPQCRHRCSALHADPGECPRAPVARARRSQQADR